MPDSQFFRSLSTLLAGTTLVFGMLGLLEISSRIETRGPSPVTGFGQVEVTLDVTTGSPYTSAPSVHVDHTLSNNEPVLQLVWAGPGIENVTLQGNPDQENDAGQNLKHDAHAVEVAATYQKPTGFENAKLLAREPYNEEHARGEGERIASLGDIGLAGEAEQTGAPQVTETSRVSHVDELQMQKPVRRLIANRYPEQSADTVTEAGTFPEGIGLAGEAEQTGAPQVTETSSIPDADELQAQEPVRTVVANRYPEQAVLAKTQTLEMDGDAPTEAAKQAKTRQHFETDPADFGGNESAKSQTSADKGKNLVASRRQDTGTHIEKKPDISFRAQQQKKSSSPTPRWKAMSLGSATQVPGTKAKTDRVSSKDYNMGVWSSIARHKPKAGRKGSATIAFGIGSNGMLRGVRVSRSSGDARLDRLAIAAVRNAAPFPKPPAGLGSQSFTVSIYFR